MAAYYPESFNYRTVPTTRILIFINNTAIKKNWFKTMVFNETRQFFGQKTGTNGQK
jgi:hypothetical protein